MIVVDTNVLAYLLIEGDRTEACRGTLQKDSEWCAPLLWRSEFRNVLALHVRHAGMTLDGALARIAEAEKLIAGRDYSVASELVLSLSAAAPVSAYDAEYVCLAKELGTKLVTSDSKLLKEFGDVAVSPENFSSSAKRQ